MIYPPYYYLTAYYLSGNKQDLGDSPRHMLQVGKADDSRLKSGNPPTALSPQRSGSPSPRLGDGCVPQTPSKINFSFKLSFAGFVVV
ncbi:hypothetical protein H6G74_10430 [Nostoc spongiaeforme FACHB-130]|uniref:Uncharacterized protein n=1 Tax=Nostoc spongiaeforme FACHB-130 TaxID=1357510 RepID=A0ABR8FTJ4_9NOSO|nr:hypothetical protein [Nostoc spongiaeforme]MBD2594742.1 hypothetical protein [Nostoc spongiaeforme FACHB-130]